MSELTPQQEIKWWNLKLLLRSLLVGLIFFGVFWAFGKRAEPPEGYVFEKLPPLLGTYHCCDGGGKYTRSWVGGTAVNCSPTGYYQFLGAGRNDCRHKETLNLRTVEVIRAITPSSGDRSPLVIKISSMGKSIYEIDDQRLRERWIAETQDDSILLGYIFFLIFHGAQLIFLRRKLTKGKKK